ASTASLSGANDWVLASVAASGKISGSLARSGSSFSNSSRTPSTGDTYPTQAVIWAACTGSYTKYIHMAAASRLTAPFGITIESAQAVAPDSGNTNRTAGLSRAIAATSPDQPIVMARLPLDRSSK